MLSPSLDSSTQQLPAPYGASSTAVETDPKPNKFLMEDVRSRSHGRMEPESRVRGWECGCGEGVLRTEALSHGDLAGNRGVRQREQQVQGLGGGNVPYLLGAPEEISKGLPQSVAVCGHVSLLPPPPRP